MSVSEVAISDLGRIVTGKTPSTKNPAFFDGDYQFVTPSDLDWDAYYCQLTKRTVTDDARNSYHNQFIPADAVMVTCIGNTIGKCAISSGDCLTNQQINTIVPMEWISPRFVYYLLVNNTRVFRGVGLGGGAATPILNKTTFSKLKLRVPPKQSWDRIASILSAYDDLIENNRRRIKLLEKAARLLYKEWFVHLRFPGHEHVTITDGVPERCDKMSVGELCSFTIGGGWGGQEHSSKFTEPGYVIRGTDLPDVRSGAFGRVPFRYHASNNLAKRALKPGDLILEVSNGNIRNVGRSYRIEDTILESFDSKVMCASFCRLLRPIGEFESLMLASHFEEMQENGRMDFFKSPSAAGINNFRFTALLDDEYILIPTDLLRAEFLALFSVLRRQLAALSVQIRQLADARDLLLPRLMNGELEV